MATINALDFTVHTQNLHHTKWIEKTYSDRLLPNQVLLKIAQFAFTSNNITYGVVGEQMDYWKFFPTSADRGILPVWGFADVIISNHSDIRIGQRFYGYYPTGSHLLVTANKVSDKGFLDGAEHRRALPAVYNFYTNATNDAAFTSETEPLIALFRPLFVTSFLIDNHLVEQNFYKATQIIITSASSKTAQALAFLLAHRKRENELNFNLIALTSKKNIAFVEQLSWYDQVLSYDELTQLKPSSISVVIDFSGNHETQFQLQTLLKERLVYNCLVGMVDWQNLEGEQRLLQKGEFFFAPTHAKNLQQEWGLAGFQQQIESAFRQFITAVQSNLLIKNHIGMKAFEQLYLKVLNGKMEPRCGAVVRLNK